jgi:hypothetical protein
LGLGKYDEKKLRKKGYFFVLFRNFSCKIASNVPPLATVGIKGTDQNARNNAHILFSAVWAQQG